MTPATLSPSLPLGSAHAAAPAQATCEFADGVHTLRFRRTLAAGAATQLPITPGIGCGFAGSVIGVVVVTRKRVTFWLIFGHMFVKF